MTNNPIPKPFSEPHPLAASDGLMDSKATAAFLGLADQSLAQWRSMGIGPDWIKVGFSVRYRRSDLEAWLESRTRRGA
jgi:predicted DNA-binding transcriptional regulator AlpA